MVKVSPSTKEDAVVRTDEAAYVVDVLCGLYIGVVAVELAYLVGDVLCIYGAAVVEAALCGCSLQGVACAYEDVVGAHQGATGVDYARTRLGIDLGDEDLFFAAIGQGDFSADKPNDVAGELRHLGWGEFDSYRDVEFFCKFNSCVHEGAVLFFVVFVACQVAAAGEGADLFTDELLFVKAVCIALLGACRA